MLEGEVGGYLGAEIETGSGPSTRRRSRGDCLGISSCMFVHWLSQSFSLPRSEPSCTALTTAHHLFVYSRPLLRVTVQSPMPPYHTRTQCANTAGGDLSASLADVLVVFRISFLDHVQTNREHSSRLCVFVGSVMNSFKVDS